jgi:hypothetical protein
MIDYTVIYGVVDPNDSASALVLNIAHVQVPIRTELSTIIAESGITNINCIFEGKLFPESLI